MINVCFDAYISFDFSHIARNAPSTQSKSLHPNRASLMLNQLLIPTYFGYKLHAVCGLSGVMHSYDMTPANVHDINYIRDVKFEFYDCSVFGDRAYISAELK